MSKAYAQMCELYATLMTDDPRSIPLDGIWGTVELPELQRNGPFDDTRKKVEFVSTCLVTSDPSTCQTAQTFPLLRSHNSSFFSHTKSTC